MPSLLRSPSQNYLVADFLNFTLLLISSSLQYTLYLHANIRLPEFFYQRSNTRQKALRGSPLHNYPEVDIFSNAVYIVRSNSSHHLH